MARIDKKTREKLRKVAHIVAALVILIHAFEKFEINEPVYPFYTVAGLLFLVVAIFHEQLQKVFRPVDSIFMIIEAGVYCLIAIEYFEKHKKALPWFYVVATVMYVIAAFIRSKKKKRRRRRRSSDSLEDESATERSS